MNTTKVVALLTVAYFSFSQTEPTAQTMTREESISGRSYLAVQAAMVEFAAKKLEIREYKITVTEEPSAVVVTFADPDLPEGSFRGNPGRIPMFVVELNKDLKVIGASFVR